MPACFPVAATDRTLAGRAMCAYTPLMRDIILIDGGGSGSRARRECDDQPVATATAGPANAFSDPGGAADAIIALVRDLAGERIPPVVAGVAGCRLPEIAARLATALPFDAHVVDDSVTTALGALGPRSGSLVSLGTGSFFLRKSGEELRHIGGWGLALGDCASGAWFGREALAATLRAADGQARKDALTESLSSPHPLMRFPAPSPADFATLAPQVFAMAHTPTAQRLIQAAVAEIESALAALEAPEDEPIVLTGGLSASLAPHLPDALRARLTPALGDPLDGARLLASKVVS